MFYISKVTPLFFITAFINLCFSIAYKSFVGINTTFLIILIFGFIGFVIMGAMYQIVPNSQSRKLSHPVISYIVFMESFLGFLLTYLGYSKIASFLLFISILTFCSHIFMNVRNWYPPTIRFLGMSILYLFLSGFLLFLHTVGFVNIQVVIHTVTIGVMLNAVYGVELAWIPMLTMTTLNVKRALRLFYAKQISTVLLILSFYTLDYRYVFITSIFEIITACYFLYIIYSLLKTRRLSADIPPAVKMFLLAMVALIPGMLLGFFMALVPSYIEHGLYTHINILVYGFTAFTIFGGVMHLLPRIVWNWIYSHKDNKPLINELVDEQLAPKFIKISFILYIVYLLTDIPFFPTKYVSFMFYLLIVIIFIKMTFFTMFKKIWRDRYVGGETS